VKSPWEPPRGLRTWNDDSDKQTVPMMVHTNINDGTDAGGFRGTREKKVTTKGEYRVGIGFNPSGDPVVQQVKRMAADLIDYIDAIEDSGEGEIRRLKAEAQTAVEGGAMWAVKAATKEPR
jgi:hypothetical protein